jgi:hypothetical protein
MECSCCGIDKESYDAAFRSLEVLAKDLLPEWKQGNTCPLCERDYLIDAEVNQ